MAILIVMKTHIDDEIDATPGGLGHTDDNGDDEW